MKKWCHRCMRMRPIRHFKKAHPDFPTRDGFNCSCKDCTPKILFIKDPETKKIISWYEVE